MDMDYIEWFAGRVTQLRLNKGVSARDMSLSLGQSESYINKIENRRTLPSMAGFLYICEYFGITPAEFFMADAADPRMASEIFQEAKKLPSDQAEHILQVLRDLNRDR